jgi:polyhydroxybutyrate depolymerase
LARAEAAPRGSVGEPVTWELRAETLEVDGRKRSLTVLSAGHEHAPLVIVLHGSNQDSGRFREFTGGAFDTVTEYGATVAYLDGYRGHWNDARVSQKFAARTKGYDDVAFVRAVIDLLVERYHGDPARVVVIGFSNGGQMVLRLVHEMPDALAAAVVLSATQPVPDNFAPTEPKEQPVPIMFVHGTRDPLVPYSGGMASLWGFRPRGAGLSAPETAAYYAKRNGITDKPATLEVLHDGRIWLEQTEYHQPDHPSVVLYTLHGAGHTIPGPKKAPVIMGRTDHTFETVRTIAEFAHLTGEADQRTDGHTADVQG